MQITTNTGNRSEHLILKCGPFPIHHPNDLFPLERLCHDWTKPSFRTSDALHREIRNPETEQFQKLLDPGSRPTSRGLAGMTDCDTASDGRGLGKEI
jgi:hypothetical protein